MKVSTVIDKLSTLSKLNLSDKIKMGFLLCCGCITTIAGMHHMDFMKTYGEKGSRNYMTTCSSENILDSTTHKTAAIQSEKSVLSGQFDDDDDDDDKLFTYKYIYIYIYIYI